MATLRDLLIRDRAVILATLSPTSFPYYVGYTLYWNAFPNADTIALAATPEYKEIILGIRPPCIGPLCGGPERNPLVFVVALILIFLIIRKL